jgi:hypothetical protein
VAVSRIRLNVWRYLLLCEIEMKDIELTEAQLDKIAELASEKSMAKFHQAVGKSVIKKGFWLAAAVGVAILVFLQEGIQK